MALVLTRAAAGLGGAIAGIGLVHIAIAGNPWGIPLLAGGLVVMLFGIRRAAQLAADSASNEKRVKKNE